ncbi:two-component system response regulator [Prosthecobacter sp.]|uniref:two-component system response regulator n=1 Tax=Prosthecobacter sp. TaxID=1965333 RepID=UPI003783A3E1
MSTTILVAVTDIFFYTKVRDALRPQGYTLERIRSQDEVAEKTASDSPAALILNMNDLAIDAFQALETLRADPALRSLPILAFANHEETDTWRRAKDLGVTKIVSRNEFSARTRELVEEIIANSSQRSAVRSEMNAEG